MSNDKIAFLPPDALTATFTIGALSETTDWGLLATGIPDAHKHTRGAGIVVAVLDTGGPNHLDLNDNLLPAINCSGTGTANDNQGHGCSIGTDRIWTSHHGVINLESLYESSIPDAVLINHKDNTEIKFIGTSNWKTTGFKINEKVFSQVPISAVHKIFYAGDVFEVKTKHETLTLTPWHPAYVVSSHRGSNQSIKRTPAENLNIGDILLCGKTCLNENYLNIKCGSKELLLDNTIAYWLGLLISDGSVNLNSNRVEFCGNNQLLVEDFARITRDVFGIKCTISSDKNSFYRAISCSVDLKKMILEYFGLKGGRKSLNVEVPKIIERSPINVVGAFVAGLIEGDGNIDAKWRIRLATGSYNFAHQLSNLLKFIGIRSFVSETDNSSGFGLKDSVGFQVRISPAVEITQHLVYKKGTGSAKPKPRRQDAIISINKKFYQGFMYDLTVPATSNYVANSMVISNTHVGGIVAALENGIGVVGVAPEAKVLPIKVLDDSGHSGFAQIADGIRAAVAARADIINMSLGAPQAPPDDFYNAIKEAHAAGVIMVAAAGNDAGAVNWPARYDEVIAVSAIDNQGNLANFSSRGDQIDFGAPGVNIYSTYLNNQYAVLNGTSQASPFIAGVCALLLSWTRNHPELPQIKNSDDMLVALGKFTDPAGRLTDGKFGLGIPHFANALTDDKSTDVQVNPPIVPETPTVPVVVPAPNPTVVPTPPVAPITPTEPVTPAPVTPKPHDNLNVSEPF